MHDRNIRNRLVSSLAGTLNNAPGIDVRRLPRPVRPLADRRFIRRLVPAAVLIGIVDDPQRLSILLTERSADMREHAGQVSFPGGRRDSTDRDVIATATREAHEEINLPESLVKPIGQLGEYPTVTGFRVTPIVALVEPAALALLAPSPEEVQRIISVPLRHILHSQHFTNGWIERGGMKLPYKSITWQGHAIWGATAAMLAELGAQVQGGIE